MTKSLAIFAFIGCLLFSACERQVSAPSSSDLKRYELKGKIVKVEMADKRIVVAHDEIKGFMEAMTMPFAVKDDAALKQVQVGDQIIATLVYNPADNRSWLEGIRKTSP